MDSSTIRRSSLVSLPAPRTTGSQTSASSSSSNNQVSSSSTRDQSQRLQSPAPSSSSLPTPLTSSADHPATNENKVNRQELEVMEMLRAMLAAAASSPASAAASGPGQVSQIQQLLGQRPPLLSPTPRPVPAASVDPRSNSGAGEDQAHAVDPLASESGSEDKMAAKITERALTMGSFTAWAQAQKFKSPRNKNEVLVLAQALDAFLKDNVSIDLMGMEILCRRVAAVHLADQSSNWKLADAIQLPTVASSLLPQSDLNQAVRTASSLARVESSLRPRHSLPRRYPRGGGGGYMSGYNGPRQQQHGGRSGFTRHPRQQQQTGRAGSAGASNQ